MTHPTRVHYPFEQAEGDVYYPGIENPIPYHTYLAGPNGVHIHFWINSPYHGQKLARKLKSFATNFNDIVSASYSGGKPTGYRAHRDMKPTGELP